MTIPSIALFGVLIPVLSLIGQGIGYLPAVIALMLYSQLPIIRNTYTAIMNVDPALREAARGMGMTTLQRLREVEMPIALPVIIAGVRNAVVLNIGDRARSRPISAPAGSAPSSRRGITQTDIRAARSPARSRVSLLAIVADYAAAAAAARGSPRPGLRLAMIRLERRHQGLRRRSRRRRPRRHGGAGGRDLRAARPVRLRQDHDDEDDQPADPADVGQDLHRRPRHRRGRRGHAAPLDRLRDPADRPVSRT